MAMYWTYTFSFLTILVSLESSRPLLLNGTKIVKNDEVQPYKVDSLTYFVTYR